MWFKMQWLAYYNSDIADDTKALLSFLCLAYPSSALQQGIQSITEYNMRESHVGE